MRRMLSVKIARPALSGKGEAADRLDAIDCIRRGLAQARKGIGRSVDEVFDEIAKESATRRA